MTFRTSWWYLDCLQLDWARDLEITWFPLPHVAELVGSCIPIHAYRGLSDPKCLFYPSGLSLCLPSDHFCLVPVDGVVLSHTHRTRRFPGHLLYQAVARIITCSIVGSRLDYCNSLFVGMTDCNFKKLQHVQNTLARVVLRAGKFEHITPALVNLHCAFAASQTACFIQTGFNNF